MRTTRLLIGLLLFWTLARGLRGQTVEQARAYLLPFEGRTNTVVTRSNGERVVGIGHNVAFDPTVKTRYTDTEIEQLFVRDYVIALGACRRGIKRFDELPLDVRLVCISLAFNVGPTGFQRFRYFRAAVGARFWEGAVTELRTSKWATQVQPRRLQAALNTLRSHVRP